MFNETFFVALGFVVFVVVAGKLGWRHIIKALDDRAAGIRREMEEAAGLREEAQALLAAQQRKRRDTEREVAAIVARANEEASRAAAEGERAAATLIVRREQLAREKIAQAEIHALKVVRSAAVDVALGATERLIRGQAEGTAAGALIDRSIRRMNEQLN